jgi:metal-responsive CopG/Arc/MetJ family transcriptional regulator
LKNINIAITDSVDQKLDEIMQKKEFKNRADAIAWLIERGFDIVTREAKA